MGELSAAQLETQYSAWRADIEAARQIRDDYEAARRAAEQAGGTPAPKPSATAPSDKAGGTSGATPPPVPWPFPGNCTYGNHCKTAWTVGLTVAGISDAGIWDDESAMMLLWLLCKTSDGTAASQLVQANFVKGPLPANLVRFVLWFAGFILPLAVNLAAADPLDVIPEVYRDRGAGIEIPPDAILPHWGDLMAEASGDVGWWGVSAVNDPLPNPPSRIMSAGLARPWPAAGDVLPPGGAAKGGAPIAGTTASPAAAPTSTPGPARRKGSMVKGLVLLGLTWAGFQAAK